MSTRTGHARFLLALLVSILAATTVLASTSTQSPVQAHELLEVHPRSVEGPVSITDSDVFFGWAAVPMLSPSKRFEGETAARLRVASRRDDVVEARQAHEFAVSGLPAKPETEMGIPDPILFVPIPTTTNSLTTTTTTTTTMPKVAEPAQTSTTPSPWPVAEADSLPEGCLDAFKPGTTEHARIRAGKHSGVAAWAELVCNTFPKTEWATAFCVMSYESGGNPAAQYQEKSGYYSVGLFQINSGNLGGQNRIRGLHDWAHKYNNGKNYRLSESIKVLLTPEWNVRAAYDIWNADGWTPAWAAQRNRCDL